MTQLRAEDSTSFSSQLRDLGSVVKREALSENTFNRMIAIERKRTERSKQPFLLMLVETMRQQSSAAEGGALENILTALLSSVRETDVVGWYKDRTTIGAMFTGLVVTNKNSLLSMILGRVSELLGNELTAEQFSQVSISFHFYPDDWDEGSSERPSNQALYPDLFSSPKDRRSVVKIKRAMDVAGSALMLVVCAPILILIAVAVKLSSKGPVLFRQQRVGQYGEPFMFFKFRSMQTNNDHGVHKEYVTKFIASQAARQPSNGSNEGVFKLTSDPRVTRLGKFLRRTSLDELPQLVNVLRGEMSLVGPRPPIPYELAAYQTWHRRRVLEVKPGITGLWQVTGRSRVNFDEMVRLDLRYATSWSPALDFTILMRTPLAVIRGEGAM